MAADTRPFKSKEQDGHGNEVIIRDQQLVEQTSQTTMASGEYFEIVDVDGRMAKIPKDNMINVVREALGSLLNGLADQTTVTKALTLNGDTLGASTAATLASVLGVYTGGRITQDSEGWYRIARIGDETQFSGILTFSEAYSTTRGGCGVIAICTSYNSLACSYIYKTTGGIIRTTKVRDVRENNNVYLEIYNTGGGDIEYGLFGSRVYQVFSNAPTGGGTVIHEVTIPT